MPPHYTPSSTLPPDFFFHFHPLTTDKKKSFCSVVCACIGNKSCQQGKARQGKARQGNSINIELQSKQCLHTTCLPSSILPPDFFFIPSMWLIHVVVVCYSLYFSKTRHYQPVQSVRHPYTFYGVARENCIVLLKLYFLCL